MACVSVLYRFADDEVIQVTVEVEASYPDALNEARATAVRAFGEAMRDGIETLTQGDDE